MSNYKDIRKNESQILIEAWKQAGEFAHALRQYLQPKQTVMKSESIRCIDRHVIIIEGFSIEDVEEALAFIKGSFSGSNVYLIEWGSLTDNIGTWGLHS